MEFYSHKFNFGKVEVKASLVQKCYADGPGSAWTEIIWDQGQDMPEGFQRGNPVNHLSCIWQDITGHEDSFDFFESMQGLEEAPEEVQSVAFPEMEAKLKAVKTAIQEHIDQKWVMCMVNNQAIGYCLK